MIPNEGKHTWNQMCIFRNGFEKEKRLISEKYFFISEEVHSQKHKLHGIDVVK